ncbi:hypothetical protein BYT27DRAFT_7236138 [Phlegmacium glaucopus]|nr:hypothetical protein BYT27DRAFT_7236138 [Phlegmacium glaucopus]
MADPQDGYLNDVFDVLDAHQHPCIVMGRSALLWMGAAVLQSSHFDLLIRNSQIAAIAEDIQRTGNWEEAPLVRTFGEDYLQPPPRVFGRMDGTFSIKAWSEEAVRLLVDPPADGSICNGHFLIEAPCCEVLSPVLLESDMHPGPKISAYKPSLLTMPNVRFLPHTHIHSQSASREPQSKVYIPTISRYLDALLAQHQWLDKNEHGASRRLSGPAADVSYLIRYLFLEMPSQRRKILPLLESESKSRMEEILYQYKRTYKPRYRVMLAEEGRVLKMIQQ